MIWSCPVCGAQIAADLTDQIGKHMVIQHHGHEWIHTVTAPVPPHRAVQVRQCVTCDTVEGPSPVRNGLSPVGVLDDYGHQVDH